MPRWKQFSMTWGFYDLKWENPFWFRMFSLFTVVCIQRLLVLWTALFHIPHAYIPQSERNTAGVQQPLITTPSICTQCYLTWASTTCWHIVIHQEIAKSKVVGLLPQWEKALDSLVMGSSHDDPSMLSAIQHVLLGLLIILTYVVVSFSFSLDRNIAKPTGCLKK